MHYYINRRVKHVLDGCSMLSGLLFQLNWNPIPTYLEQESNLTVTRRELKKFTTRAYRMRSERWRLEVGWASWWRISSFKAVGLDLFLRVCLREENRLLVNKTYHIRGDNAIKWQA